MKGRCLLVLAGWPLAATLAVAPTILILGNPADEPAAMAVTVKGSKSNASE